MYLGLGITITLADALNVAQCSNEIRRGGSKVKKVGNTISRR